MDEQLSCPGCGSISGFIPVDKLPLYSLIQCVNCSLEFSQPMKSLGGEWYDKAYVIRHSAIDTRIRDYYKWAIGSLPRTGKLLDIGCGEGVFVNYAQKSGLDAYGIDFSNEAIQLGQRWFGLRTIYNCSLAELRDRYRLSKFDIITFFEVLEHIEKPDLFMSEINAFLRPGGVVAISVPFRDRWPLRDFGDYPPNHLTRWTERSLRIFFVRHGFEGVHIVMTSRLRSYHNFLGYFVRRAVYGMFGMYAKGFNVTEPNSGEKIFSRSLIKKMITFLKPRQLRDILLWPIALISFPLFFPWFKGGNLMLLATKGSAAAAFNTPRALQNESWSFIDRSLNYGRHIIKDFLTHASPFRTVLDIGAGHGDDLLLARSVAPSADIHAVEVYPAYAADLARKGIHVHSLNIEKDRLPFPDGSVDVIIANQILEHVKELFWIFHEISRTLPVGGKLIVGVPNLAALHNRILLAFGRQPSPLKNNSAHIRGFTKHDLMTFLNGCFPGGYELRAFRGSNFYPFPPVAARPFSRMFPNLAWSIFFLVEKQREYHREFLEYPVANSLETNFFLGNP